MNNLTTIYVVRHGESEGNIGIFHNEENNKLGSPLTLNGIKQATELTKKLANIKILAIFSSDLARTKQTAEIIAINKNLEVNTSSLIRERSFHHYIKTFNNSITEDELKLKIKKDLEKLNDLSKMKYKYNENMESAEDGALRLLTYIREASAAYSGKTILVVAHGNIMRSLLVHLGFAAFDELPEGSIENTGYFVLESDGIEFTIKDTYLIEKQINKVRLF